MMSVRRAIAHSPSDSRPMDKKLRSRNVFSNAAIANFTLDSPRPSARNMRDYSPNDAALHMRKGRP